MSGPRLSDPGSSPRFPHRRDAQRQKPIWTREQFGPWQCDVRVTPITGLRKGYPVFEVSCAWQHGPALDRSLGAAPPGGMAAVDQYVIDKEVRDLQLTAAGAAELAVTLGKVAAELLEQSVKPDLFALCRELVKRRK